MNNDTTPKYVLAIYNCTYRFIYYALKSEDKALAFAEAAIKAMKAKSSFCWFVLLREDEPKYKRAAEYKAVARFYRMNPDASPADDCGEIDYGFAARDWRTPLGFHDII